MLRPIANRLFAQTVRRAHGGNVYKPPHMDELPLPSGSWQAQYDANQRKYNATLAFGVVFAVASLVVAKTSGLVYLNFSPPKTYE